MNVIPETLVPAPIGSIQRL